MTIHTGPVHRDDDIGKGFPGCFATIAATIAAALALIIAAVTA
jgi:hypothetical protein